MPRLARSLHPDAILHVRSRFVDGRFVLDEESRHQYLIRLDAALLKSDWSFLGYALMSTHVHLGLLPGTGTLGSLLGPVHNGMAQWVNRRKRRRGEPKTLGHVFGDRPSSNEIPIARAGIVLAYIHNNPRNAGLVTTAAESDWTSHRQYLGLDQKCRSLDVEAGLDLCGGMTPADFDAFVQSRALPSSASLVQVLVDSAASLVEVCPEDVRGGSRARVAVFARRVAIAAAEEIGIRRSQLASEMRISRVAVAKLAEGIDPAIRETARQVLARVGHTSH